MLIYFGVARPRRSSTLESRVYCCRARPKTVPPLKTHGLLCLMRFFPFFHFFFFFIFFLPHFLSPHSLSLYDIHRACLRHLRTYIILFAKRSHALHAARTRRTPPPQTSK